MKQSCPSRASGYASEPRERSEIWLNGAYQQPNLASERVGGAAGAKPPGSERDEGVALLLALLATAVVLAIGLGLVTIASIDTAIAGASRSNAASLEAADSAAERALQDLARLDSWSLALNGSVRSTFALGPTVVSVPARGLVDLAAETASLQAASDAFARLAPNNPVWRLFAWGWLGEATGASTDGLPFAAVWVFDDVSEADNDPEADSNGRIGLRAVAFGPSGAERAVDLLVAQITDPVGVKVIAWRAMR